MAAHGRVLVVDDNAEIRGLLRQILLAAGCFVVTADCAHLAYSLILSENFDVAFIDHQMPDMTGAELIRLIRSSARAEVRGLPLLGFSDEFGCAQLSAAGATEVLFKPGSLSMIQAMVRKYTRCEAC